ncbi:MAG: hemerythrin family protein [Rhodocyclaceae bacterium]|jgi:hemerythrin-like metal-binding protein|nr:hemerythrin family protein [Rhodocyclaceae bacterium]
MSRVRWSADLECGVKVLDLQHQELVAIINAMEDCLDCGEFQLELSKDVMRRLASYIVFHFQTEERLMVGHKVASKHAEAHRREHQAFADFVSKAAGRLEEGRLREQLPALSAYLHKWLLDHVTKTDRQLAKYIL